MNEKSVKQRKLLILCADRDDDIERFINEKTPIIGREKVLESAIKFALVRPEDSDSNALFAAIQIYDKISRIAGKDKCEVAVIAGTPEEGVEADMKMLSELDKVLEKFNAEGVIIVSDGPTDEQIASIIQSKIPIVSMKRVIVQQSRGVEESFVLVTRYLKMLVTEPKFRKYSLGIPGLFIILQALFYLLGYIEYFWTFFTLILGFILIAKGFALDEKLKILYTTSPLTFSATMVFAIILILGMSLGYHEILYQHIEDPLLFIVIFLSLTLGGAIRELDLLIIGLLFIVGGKILDETISGKEKDWKKYVIFTFILFLRPVLIEGINIILGSGSLITFIYWLFLSFMISTLVAGFFVIKQRVGK